MNAVGGKKGAARTPTKISAASSDSGSFDMSSLSKSQVEKLGRNPETLGLDLFTDYALFSDGNYTEDEKGDLFDFMNDLYIEMHKD